MEADRLYTLEGKNEQIKDFRAREEEGGEGRRRGEGERGGEEEKEEEEKKRRTNRVIGLFRFVLDIYLFLYLYLFYISYVYISKVHVLLPPYLYPAIPGFLDFRCDIMIEYPDVHIFLLDPDIIPID